jgi:hypothetical protein
LVDWSRRGSAALFGGVIAAALPIILYQGREQWFFLDEWDFLADRRANSFGDLMRPHNEHWSTVPIVVYRVLFHVVGLRHYWPYQLSLVLLHLAVAVLLWTVMRRAGVHPWIATAAASLFALLGSGRQNIEFAFQIGFTGSLAFGLAFLLFADHDGAFQRRDLLGVACGALALMSSGVGVIMVAVVAVATLLRRGWKLALALTAPLAGFYVLWYATYGNEASTKSRVSVSGVARFSRIAIANAFRQLGQVSGMGLVLGAVVITGVTLTLLDTPISDLRRRHAATAGLAFGAVAFAVTTAYGRSGIEIFGSQGEPRASRYVHVLAALLLPLIAVSASQVAHRWRPLVIVGVAVFLVGVPGNIRALRPTGVDRFTQGDPDLILALAQVPQARVVPRDVEPMRFTAGGMTIGWLLDAKAAGRLPVFRAFAPGERANAVLLLSLRQMNLKPTGACRAAPRDEALRLERGQEIVLPNGFSTVRRIAGGRERGVASYLVTGGLGHVVRVELGPLEVRIQPNSASDTARVCAGPGRTGTSE